jgi:vacuolar-type H+-ATPase subunit I/STV1
MSSFVLGCILIITVVIGILVLPYSLFWAKSTVWSSTKLPMVGSTVKSNLLAVATGVLILIVSILNYSNNWSGGWTHFLTIIGTFLTAVVIITSMIKSQTDVAWIWGILILMLVYLLVPRSEFGGTKESNLSKYFNSNDSEEKVPASVIITSTRSVEPDLPPNALTVVRVPSCLSDDWAKIDIPLGWTLTDPPWNLKVARYQYRSVVTGEWEETPEGGADAVRLCALRKSYIDDIMPLKWKKA